MCSVAPEEPPSIPPLVRGDDFLCLHLHSRPKDPSLRARGAGRRGHRLRIRDRVPQAGQTILADIDLALEAGAHVAIVGPSGAGKSSLAGLLLGWHRAASGRRSSSTACRSTRDGSSTADRDSLGRPLGPALEPLAGRQPPLRSRRGARQRENARRLARCSMRPIFTTSSGRRRRAADDPGRGRRPPLRRRGAASPARAGVAPLGGAAGRP